MKRHGFSAILATIALSATALPLLSGCNGSNAIVENETVFPAQELEKQDLMNYISVAGSVEGTNIVHVTTELSEKVTAVNVELGSSVQAGDILCTFDATQLQKQYDKLKTASERTQAQKDREHEKNLRALSDAKESKTRMLQKAQKSIDRAQEAKKRTDTQISGMETKLADYAAQIDALANALEDADALETYHALIDAYNALGDEITAARATLPDLEDAIAEAQEAYRETERAADDAIALAQEVLDAEQDADEDEMQAQLDAIQQQIEHCVVKASRSGVVTALNITEGSIPTAPTLMTIEDTDALCIHVSIPETDILSVHTGQKATIRTTATGDAEFTGSVSRVINILSSSGTNEYGESTSGYSAEITIAPSSTEQNAPTLLIGMSAKVKIVLDEKPDVFAVPYDAIGETENGTPCIVLAKPAEDDFYTVTTMPVEIGMETNFYTEVIADSLTEGDLILTDISELNEGDLIRVSTGYLEDQDDEETPEAFS